MSTMAQLIDRAYRDWLRPSDRQPIYTRISSGNSITAAEAQTVNYDAAYLGPDEEDQIAPGLIVEIIDATSGEAELMRVDTATLGSDQFTVRDRGLWNTTPRTHAALSIINLDPPPPRQAVFDALADAIYALYPRLYRSLTYDTSQTTFEPPDDFIEAISWTSNRGGRGAYARRPFRVENTPLGYRVYTGGGFGRLVYEARFDRPTAESDDLEASFGVLPAWEEAVIADACASILASSDIGAADRDILTEQLESQGYPVRSGESISRALAGFAAARVNTHSKALYRNRDRGVTINDVRM